MPSQVLSSVENNFTKGLITEFTGLNFPENAATDTDNCIYTLVGDVTRREGFDYEENFSTNIVSRGNSAISSYKWNNVSGDGQTQLVVQQVGNTLFFYNSTAATQTSPLSAQMLGSTVILNPAVGTFDSTLECQYADGNGYLFVYHPSMDPIFCSFSSGQVTSSPITVKIRDFTGVVDGLDVSFRPSTLSVTHQYNLQNQGWTAGSPYTAISSTVLNAATFGLGSHAFTVASGIAGVTNGDIVSSSQVYSSTNPRNGRFNGSFAGTVTSYVGTTLTINVTTWVPPSILSPFSPSDFNSEVPYSIIPTNTGYINTWVTAEGNYPSNADVWWYFKNTSNVFAPATTVPNVTLNSGNAPRGHYVLNAFQQLRSTTSAVGSLSDVTTTVRPRTGTWFQGRVWYAGVDASQPADTTSNAYSWSESLYFSQIITDSSQFGNCFQTNDPTSQTLFDLLPTDGGVIQIQGCGAIYKLFSLMNAMLVFAANGVWYLTGSQGIGFSASDYTIVKLSSVKSISGASFVDINGLPMFWNEEGIYSVEPAKQGQGLLNSPLHVNPLEVNPLTVGTILTYYNSIPLQSKKYARGAYNPIDYVVQWCFRSTDETDVNSRYTYDKILNFNNSNKAFYPYSFSSSSPSINGIVYVSSPGGSTAPNSVFKYLTSTSTASTFSEEIDASFVDWRSSDGVGVNFNSYFVTGFKLHGQGQRRFQVPYLYVFSRGDTETSYKIQGIWDYATTGNSGRWSVAQLINNWSPNFGMIFRRHKIRGQGLVLQIKVSSADGEAFDIMGWSSFETQNVGV